MTDSITNPKLFGPSPNIVRGVDGGPPYFVEPLSLLRPARFDIAAKYIYARQAELGVNLSVREHTYKQHLEIWNGFFEAVPVKRSYDDFRSAFDQILQATRQASLDGLDSAIPLALDGTPLNGAHRIAAALVYGRKLLGLDLEVQSSMAKFDYRFFRAQAALTGRALEFETAFDEMALTYCRLKPNTFMIVLFPETEKAEINSILSEYGSFVYEKRVALSANGAINLIALLYAGEPWLAADGDFSGAKTKAAGCFPKGSGIVRVVVLETDDRARLPHAKKRIRELFTRGNDTVHINDTHAETMRIAETLFNDNSIHFLNWATPTKPERFRNLLSVYSERVRDTDSPERFCVDGSAVMAAYGIRDCLDFDYLHTGDGLADHDGGTINSHNDHAHHYSNSIDSIVHDPRGHFFHAGLKFAALPVVRNWKSTRAEEKDLIDVTLIDAWIGTGSEETLAAARQLRATMMAQQALAGLPVILIHGSDRNLAEEIAGMLCLYDGVARGFPVEGRNYKLHVLTEAGDLTRPIPKDLLGTGASPASMLAPSDFTNGPEILAGAIGKRSRLRIFVLRDGLPPDDPFLMLSQSTVSTEQYLAVNAGDREIAADRFYDGLRAFSWLNADPLWLRAVLTKNDPFV